MDPKDMLGVLLHSTDEQQNAIAGQSLETKPSPFLRGQRALSTFFILIIYLFKSYQSCRAGLFEALGIAVPAAT